MLLCNFRSPSGDQSQLYTELQSRFGDDAATRIWNSIRSQEFANKFLDGELYDNIMRNHVEQEGQVNLQSFKFELDIAHSIPTNEQGEPTLDWVLSNLDVPKEAANLQRIDFQQDTSTGYTARTKANASADATIAIAYNFGSKGELLTKKLVNEQSKKYIAIPVPAKRAGLDIATADYKAAAKGIVDQLNSVEAKTLNIAGNGIYTMKDAGWNQAEVDAMTYNLLKAVTEHPDLKNKIESIRTGGQTGYDEAGAKAGLKLGIPTTILAPKGWKFRDINGKDISNEAAFKARFGAEAVPVQKIKAKDKTTKEPVVKETPRSAITTADFGTGKKDSRMPYVDAMKVVNDFYEIARANPTQKYDASSFKVQDIKKPTSSGYNPLELANLFASYPIPANVVFDPLFSALVVNTSTFQMSGLTIDEVPFLKYSDELLQDVLDEYFIPVRNTDGTKTGKTFTSEQQVAGVDAIVTEVWRDFAKAPNLKVGAYLSKGGTLYNRMDAYAKRSEFKYNLPAWVSDSMADSWAANIRSVMNSWDDFVRRALYRLESYGLSVKNRSAVDDMQSLLGDDTGDDTDATLQGEEGRGLVAWSDSSFEQDPRDTAHTRIKLFLASIREVTIGTEREPQKLKLAFNDKTLRDRLLGKNAILGTKTETIRTAAQVADLGIKPGQQYITSIDDDGTKVKFRVTANQVLTADDLEDENIQSIAQEENIDPQVGDMILGLQRWVPNQNTLLPRENFLGFPNLVDFEGLFQNLLETLNNTPNNLQDILTTLETEGKDFKPVYWEVARQLKLQSKDIQNEFIKVMSKQYQEFSILLFSKRRGGLMDMTEINANQGSAINTIMDRWRENQKNADMVVRDPSGNLVVNSELAQKFMSKLVDLQEIYRSGQLPNVEENLKPFAKEILEANGIVMPGKAFDYLFAKTAQVTKNTVLAGGIHDQFQITAEGKPKGIFSAMVMKLAGVTQEEARNEADVTYLLNNNPLYTENTAMRTLARLTYRNSPQVSAGSHKNSKGKSIYAFGQNSFLSSTMKMVHNDPGFLQNIDKTYLGHRNWLVQRMLTDSESKDKFDIRYVDGLKQAYRRNSRGIERPDMSSREQLLFALGQFQNQKSAYGNFLSLTHSDKKTTPLFMGINKFNPESADAKQAIFDTVLGEYERIKHWYVETKQNQTPTANDSYNKGGGLYYFLPELNYDFLTKLEKQGKVTKNDIALLWQSKGTPNTRTSVVSLKPFIQKIFETYYQTPEVNKLVQIMKNEEFDTQGLIDYAYLKKNITNIGYTMIATPSGQRIFMDAKQQQVIPEATIMEAMIPWLAKDYIVNSFLVDTALSSLFFGDPALAFKGKSSVDFVQVAETMVEYQKRLAKDIAPGQDPTWATPNEKYKTITLQDDERIHKYLESLDKYADKDINATDAQELTTVREHLYVLYSLGGNVSGKSNTALTPKIYQEMLAIIDKGLKEPDKYYEFTKPEHKAVIMQIMKPVSVSHDFDSVPGTAVIHYVKSSSMALYPPMTKYFEIDELRKAMEGDGTPETHIPRANFISAKKMGAAAGKGVKIFDKSGNINIDTKSPSWATAQQTLDRNGLRIQQEVPYDETHDEILTGSQMNKLFTEGITDLTFNLPGVGEVSGKELKQIKEDTRKALVDSQLNDYLDKVGAVRAGDTIRINDGSKLLSILEDEAISRSYPPNDLLMLRRQVEKILPDGTNAIELAIPLFFNPSANKFESLMMSLIKKVGQVYFPGKSYIQASSSGFRFKSMKTFDDITDHESQGIIWVPGYDGTELKTMTKSTSVDTNGKTVSSTSPAQVLIPWNFMLKNIVGDNGEPNLADYITQDKVTGKKMLNLDKVPAELLQLIGFRIPTQKQNSMLPMQVVGFLPSNMGDTIIVPAAITLQMGSDFDVDKLYTYRRPYKKGNGGFTRADNSSTKEQLGANPEEWEQLKDATKQKLEQAGVKPNDKGQYNTKVFNQYLAEAVKEKYGEQEVPKHTETVGEPTDWDKNLSKYFDIMWTVLTSPDMYDTVMQPLDKDDLKAEAKRAAGSADKISHFYSPVSQLSDFTSQKDAKAMIGITSQFVTAAVWGEDMNMFAGGYVQNDSNEDVTFDSDNQPIVAKPELSPQGVKFIPEGSDEEQHAYWISKRAEGIYENEDTGQTEYRTKIEDIVTLQNELLDHAKNRTIDNLNINLQTVYAALAGVSLSSDSGSKPSWKHMVLLLRQPSIQRLTRELARSQDSLSETFDPKLFNNTLNKLIQDYNDDPLSIPGSRVEEGALDITKLKDGLNFKNTPEQRLYQVQALQLFERLNTIGREMGMFQRVFNQDPKGPGKNMITVLASLADEQAVKDSSIIANGKDLFNSEQGYIHTVELNTARDVYHDVLPYHTISQLSNQILTEAGRTRFNLETTQDLVTDFKSYVFSNPELGLSSNTNQDRFRLLYGNSKTGEKTLAARVWEAQNSWGADNYFLRRLRPQQAESINAPSYVFYEKAQTSSLDDQENSAAFLQILRSADETQRALGEDLVRYSYVTGGISGSLSFIRYIPADYLIALPFASKLRETISSLSDPEAHADYDDFVEQWIRHNPQMIRKLSPEMINGKQVPGEAFQLASPTPKNKVTSIAPLNDFGQPQYPTYISFFDTADNTWKLYKQSSVLQNDYRRIDTLGNSYISEFTHQAGYQRSIFTENRAYIEPEHGSRVKVDNSLRERSIVDPSAKWNTIGITNLAHSAEVTNLLQNISKNKKIDNSLRILAEELAPIINVTQRTRPMSLDITTPSQYGKGVVGNYDSDTGIIHIYPNEELTANGVTRILLHEVLHGITTIYSVQSNKTQQQFPEVQKALDKVKESQQEAMTALQASIEAAGYTVEEVKDAITKGSNKDTQLADFANLYYSLASPDEYVSNIFESQILQKFLNDQTSKLTNKSLLASVIEAIKNFINSVAQSLGINIKKDSMLQVGLERSFNLVQQISQNAEQIGAPIDLVKAISDTYFNGSDAWVVNNEHDATRIANQIEDDFNQVEVSMKHLSDSRIWLVPKIKDNFKVDLSPDEYRASTNPIDKLYGKVQEQIQDIRSSIAKNKKNADVLHQSQLLTELKILANDLKATQDLDKVKDLAGYQLNWADNVKDKFNDGLPVSINQIMTAFRLTTIWTSMLDLMYNSGNMSDEVDYDNDFVNIQARAEKLRSIFLGNIMKQTLNNISQDGLTDEDYKNIKDMPVEEAKFLDISRAESKITQEVGLTIQNAHRAYLEQGQRLLKEITDFEKEATELAKKRGQKVQDFYENFMQGEDGWGLVTRFTPAFFSWKSRQRTKLNEKLDSIEATITDKSQKATATKAAWSAYWRNIDRNGGFVDVRVVFDPETGEDSNSTAAVKYRNEINEEYGPKLAAELMAEAKTKYQQFLQDRADVTDMYDTQVEEGMMTEEEANNAKSAWELQYSPADKITSRTVPGKNYSLMSEKYLVMVPHNDSTDLHGNSFFDSKYSAIQADPELQAFYDKIQDFMERFTGNLPYYLDSKLGPNFLPAIQKELLTSITDVPQYLKGAGKQAVNMLTASSYEEFMEARSKKDIPILYMDNPFEQLAKPAPDAPKEEWDAYQKAKTEKLKSYTRNLPRILELFGLMSEHYKTFSNARDAIDLGTEIIKKAHEDLQKGTRQIERNGKLTTVTSNLSNTLGALEYTKDVLMYKRSRHLEGKISDIARLKQKKDAVAKLKDLRIQEKELEEKFANNEITAEEYAKAEEAIALDKSKYEVRKLYASKVGDTLITWTQLKSLSYNPLSAVNNLAFGLISATIFANQNQEYGWKEFRKAFSIMLNATGRSVGLTRITGNKSAMNETAEKILNIMDRMNVMGELTETAYSKSNLPEQKSALRTVMAPYQMLRTGDYFVKGLNTIATLLRDKVTVDGQEMSVWESIDKDGNWIHKDMPEWQSENPADQKSWNKVRNKIIGVNKIIMGNQDKSSPMWAKKNILFRLVGQFRLSWLSEGFASRFEKERQDIQLGRAKKGRYRTYADLGFLGSVQVLGRQLLSALPGVNIDPYKDRALKNGKDITDTDKANMRANLSELGWFLLLFGAAKVIAALAAGDDDEEKKKYLWLMANLATRTYQDVGLYAQPTIFDSILGTPAPALGTIKDTINFAHASLKWATDDDYEFQQWLLKFTKMGLPIPQSTLYNRWQTMTSKDVSTIQR